MDAETADPAEAAEPEESSLVYISYPRNVVSIKGTIRFASLIVRATVYLFHHHQRESSVWRPHSEKKESMPR